MDARLDRLLAQADAYRCLAAALHDPDGPQPGAVEVDALASASAELGVTLNTAEQDTLRQITDTAERGREHRALFGHTVAHGCPPYETEYGEPHVFAQTQELADLRGFYQAFGVRPAAHGERPDHVVCELEFLSFLSLKEAVALTADDAAAAEVVGTATASFLSDHLARWMPALAGRAERRAPGSGLALLLRLAERIVAVHAAGLGLSVAALDSDSLRPLPNAPEGFAFACGVPEAAPQPPG